MSIKVMKLIIFLLIPSVGGLQAQTRTKPQAKALADVLFKKLVAGADFATLAKEYSDDPGSQSKGGKYLNVHLGDMTPEFEKVVYNLTINLVSKPFLTPYGYHIARLSSRNGNVYSFRHILISFSE